MILLRLFIVQLLIKQLGQDQIYKLSCTQNTGVHINIFTNAIYQNVILRFNALESDIIRSNISGIAGAPKIMRLTLCFYKLLKQYYINYTFFTISKRVFNIMTLTLWI